MQLPKSLTSSSVLSTDQRLTEELGYLKKRLLSDRVRHLELQDINTEFSRLNLQLELYSLNRDIRSLEVELDEPSRQMMTAIQKELSGGQRIADEELDKLVNNIATIRYVLSPRRNMSSNNKISTQKTTFSCKK